MGLIGGYKGYGYQNCGDEVYHVRFSAVLGQQAVNWTA